MPVYEAAGEIIRRAREGGGPSLLECEGDAQTYKAKGENEDNRAHRDCLRAFSARVTQAGVIGSEELEAIDREVGRYAAKGATVSAPRR